MAMGKYNYCNIICYSCYGDDLDDTFAPIPSEISNNAYGFVFKAFRFLNQGTSGVYMGFGLQVALASDGNAINPVSENR